MERQIMIQGVHSAIIWTGDFPRLLSFYRDTVGLESEFEGDAFVMFKSSLGGQLGLGAHSEVTGQSKEPVRVMVNFTVADIAAEYERLKSRGVNFTKAPEVDPGDGFTIATFIDPDGNTLQLFQPPS
jgi:predicted enzyme related to lactoylglutathione lyase